MFYNRQNLKLSKKMHVILQKIFCEELDDPIFKKISINYLRINNKKTLATIYLDIENVPQESNVLSKLKILCPFLKRKLSYELSRFKVPDLKFVDDATFKNAMKIEYLINLEQNDKQ